MTVKVLIVQLEAIAGDIKGNIAKLNSILDKNLDPETYRNDPEKLERVTFIQKAIEARLQYNLTDRRLIINHVLSKINFNPHWVVRYPRTFYS